MKCFGENATLGDIMNCLGSLWTGSEQQPWKIWEFKVRPLFTGNIWQRFPYLGISKSSLLERFFLNIAKCFYHKVARKATWPHTGIVAVVLFRADLSLSMKAWCSTIWYERMGTMAYLLNNSHKIPAVKCRSIKRNYAKRCQMYKNIFSLVLLVIWWTFIFWLSLT